MSKTPTLYEERRAQLEELLDHFEHYFQPGGSTTGGAGDGAGPTLSTMAHSPPVVELIRCLELCRRLAPQHYKHLLGHYDAEWRLVQKPTKRRDVRGNWVDAEERVRERVVPAWVARRIVDRALDFLLGVWRFPDTVRCAACRSRDPLVRCAFHVRLELPYAIRKGRRARLVAYEDETGRRGWTDAA